MADTVETGSLLGEERFRRFCLAKVLQLSGQNTLIYGLFVAIVRDEASAIATSAFILASVVPSVLLSIPAGSLADVLPRKGLLLGSLALRLFIVWLFIRSDPNLSLVLLLTFLVWTAYQFFTPSENAALTAVVPQGRLPAAISLLHALSLLSQVLGAGVIAPLLIKFASDDGLYWVVFACFWLSAATYLTIPRLTNPEHSSARRRPWTDLPAGWRLISHDATLKQTTKLRILVDTASMMVLVAVPTFVQEVLNTGAENTIYIALPGALGLAAGLFLAPALLRVVEPGSITRVGFWFFIGVLILLPFIDSLAASLPDVAGISKRFLFVCAVIPFAGLGVAFVQVASRAAVYREVGEDSIARVLATQSAIGSTAALAPTLASGALIDLLPVRVVFATVAVLGILIALVPIRRVSPRAT